MRKTAAYWIGMITITLIVGQLIDVGPAVAQVTQAEMDTLKRELDGLRRADTEKQRRLDELQRIVESLQKARSQEQTSAQASAPDRSPIPAPAQPVTAEAALEQAIKEIADPREQQATTDIWSRRMGDTTLRLIDISLDALFAAGSSTKRDESLQRLQGGGHDPRKRGFTLQNVEVSLSGAVDPYLTGEAHIIYFIDPISGESIFEMEEAFLTTTGLPWGFQLEAGQSFTEFGIINPEHPHQWHWQDQPVINSRLFGPDGMRQTGFRLGWLAPLPWFSELHVGVQNANGETMASFLANGEFFDERPIGGRPFVDRDVRSLKDLAYSTRWVNSWNVSDTITTKLGLSGLFGPNASGPDGHTRIYGADLKLKWQPTTSFRGWPFFLWQSEVMGRDYVADRFSDGVTDLPRKTLRDRGFYTQALYGFSYGWAAGLRYEYATGSGQSAIEGGRQADPFRDDRHRISPLLAWHPSEFSRIRLQYNYDRADHLERQDAHSVWLGVEFLYGAHPAHKY